MNLVGLTKQTRCGRFAKHLGTAFICAFSLLASEARALDPGKTLTQYAHRIWGQEEGLFQPTVYSILQTSDGFLWLGTQDSLLRFDGAHFREFDDNGQPIFHRSVIRSLLEDHQHNLWVASAGSGLAKIGKDGSVVHYTVRQGLPNDSVFCLDRGTHDDLWACTAQGLVHFDDGRMSVLTVANGLVSNDVRSTCHTPDGTRWVAGLNFGLSRSRGSRFERYTDAQITGRENITALTCASDGTVWVGYNNGLDLIRSTGSRSLSTRNGLPDDAVSALWEDRDGTIWIGTNDGVSRFRNGDVNVYRTQDGLSHSLVLSLFVDREGTLWAGTKNGLDQFTDAKVTPFTTNEGMPSNDVGPVLEDHNHRLWVGTLNKGLTYFDGKRFRAITRATGLIDNQILSLESDASGDLWVGTAKGISRLHSGKVIQNYSRRNGLTGTEVLDLVSDSTGVIWAGTDKGLNRWNGHSFEQVNFDTRATGDRILSLASGQAVRLFVSTNSSGFYSIENSKATSYLLDVVHSVDCFYIDHDRHTAWMGTLGSGLLRWKNGVLHHIYVRDGLYDNRIYSILRDDHENFWLASSKGIFRVSVRELDDLADGRTHSITSVPFTTGQLRFECQSGVQPAAFRTHDGKLWFSTTNGLVVVDPNHLASNNVAPPVKISSIIIDGRRVTATQNLRLEPGKRNLEIRYSALSFVSPEKVAFRYRLNGFDKTWTDAGNRREAFFTNLPPGNYRFVVTASNADGISSPVAAVLPFVIEPKIYQRAWFFPCVALALALAIVAGYRIRIRRLKLRFNLVLAERNRIARELHDTLLQGLSGITMQLQALCTKLPASKEKTFLSEIIRDAGRCSSEARQSLWGLRRVDAETLVFSQKLSRVVADAAREQPIEVLPSIEPVDLSHRPETEYQLLRIAQEALRNVITHSRATTVDVSLHIHEQILRFAVSDNGIGFDVGNAQFRAGHYGIVGMTERAAEIGATIEILSAPGRGTVVSVQLSISPNRTDTSNAGLPLEHQLR